MSQLKQGYVIALTVLHFLGFFAPVFDQMLLAKEYRIQAFQVVPSSTIDGSTPEKSAQVGQPHVSVPEPQLEWVRPSKGGDHFVRDESGARFVVWGVNYDHDRSGRLIEDYWNEEWSTVVEDFKEMKSLGANVVRVHLQTARFIKKSHEPNRSALRQLARLVRLAEQTGLYLNITGLGCYHKNDVPKWYDAMGETERWELQALFWGSVAETCAQSPAVFC